MGSDNGPRIAKVEFGNGHTKGQRVHQPPCEQQAFSVTMGQVFVQQEQVVAEVEVGLAGIALRQAAATQVIDMARRHHQQFISCQTDAPAQVNLLHVGKKVLIQSTHVPIKQSRQ